MPPLTSLYTTVLYIYQK